MDYNDGNISGAATAASTAMSLTATLTEQNVTPIVETPSAEAAIVGNYSAQLGDMIQQINNSGILSEAGANFEAIVANLSSSTTGNNAGGKYSEAYDQLDQLNMYIVQNYALPQFSVEFNTYYATYYQGLINSGINYARSHGNDAVFDRLSTLNTTINSVVENLTSTGQVSGYFEAYYQYYGQINSFINYTQSIQLNTAPNGGLFL